MPAHKSNLCAKDICNKSELGKSCKDLMKKYLDFITNNPLKIILCRNNERSKRKMMLKKLEDFLIYDGFQECHQ